MNRKLFLFSLIVLLAPVILQGASASSSAAAAQQKETKADANNIILTLLNGKTELARLTLNSNTSQKDKQTMMTKIMIHQKEGCTIKIDGGCYWGVESSLEPEAFTKKLGKHTAEEEIRKLLGL